jgi:dihydroorotate dehydrogenase
VIFLHRLLLWLPPEAAHSVAKTCLRIFQWAYFKFFRQTYRTSAAIHVPSVSNLKFPSRVGIAAGLDKNAEFFAALGVLGAGFVEVGTVTPFPQDGNPKPRLWRPAPGILINHMGFNNVGLAVLLKHIERYRRYVPQMPILANIGKNRDTALENASKDYERGFQALKTAVDGFVVNLSSPNTPGLQSLQTESFLESLASFAPAGMPVWIKLSPDLTNEALAKLAIQVKNTPQITGLVLANTSREMAQEFFGWEHGGLSGRPLFSRSLELVSLARDIVGPGKTIVGVGGIWTKDSAIQMRRAGADLVEVYTAFVYRGAELLKSLQGLE